MRARVNTAPSRAKGSQSSRYLRSHLFRLSLWLRDRTDFQIHSYSPHSSSIHFPHKQLVYNRGCHIIPSRPVSRARQHLAMMQLRLGFSAQRLKTSLSSKGTLRECSRTTRILERIYILLTRHLSPQQCRLLNYSGKVCGTWISSCPPLTQCSRSIRLHSGPHDIMDI